MIAQFVPDAANPQMVTLARLSRGLNQATLASIMGITQGTLSKIEAGVASVSEGELDALTSTLGYPRRFFFIRTRFDGGTVSELYHNRKRKMTKAMALTQAYACATIRRLHVERLTEGNDLPDNRFPFYPSEEYGDPIKTARTVRAMLELPDGPIFNVVEAIEQAGGIIIECEFASRQIDGFSRWRQQELPPLFFINRDAPPDRKRRTLAHELGHAAMHTNVALPYEGMETEADAFASEFLTPAHLIKPQLHGLNLPRLAALKERWKVSMQSLVMRAAELNVISPRQKTYLFTQLAPYRISEPPELDPPSETPTALHSLVRFHLDRLGYSVAELAEALSLTTNEFKALYLPGTTGLEIVK